MAIPCSRCGREYDVTLFQFGRTIRCTCGAQVGLEKRIPRAPGDRFLADAMLGRLARRLRALGYDAAFEAEIADEVAVRRAIEEDRLLLTRDRRLASEWRVEGILVLEAEDPDEQLRELAGRVPIRFDERTLFTRCLRCNARLERLSRSEAAARVPSRVADENASFSVCPQCDRVYWPGSHTERMRQRLARLIR